MSNSKTTRERCQSPAPSGVNEGGLESHPWSPFLPDHCRLLMLGSFPPARKRWSMDFFYPNFTNDMWRIVGFCFFGDKNHFVDADRKTFRIESLIPFLHGKGIGLYDTAKVVKRLKNTAADKDLEVVEPTDLRALLHSIPECTDVVTTGEKATDVCCQQLNIAASPAVGTSTAFPFEGRQLRLWRMPSSSRAYPMAVEKKAETYQRVFETIYQPANVPD